MPIGSDVVGPTVLSATSDVQLGGASWKVPAGVKSILAVIPVVSSPGGPTAAQPIAAKLTVESDDVKVAPFIVPAQIIGSSLGLSGVQPSGKSMQYPMNLSVSGGNEINFYGTGLFDHTIEPYMSVTIIYADYVVTPQYHAKLGTFTNTGTAAAEASGTAYSISGAKAIKKVIGLVVGTTVATTKGIMGKIRMKSSDFKVPWELKFHVEPCHGVIATNATTASAQEATAGVVLLDVDIPVASPCNIQDYFTLAVALTTTGNFLTGVMYV